MITWFIWVYRANVILRRREMPLRFSSGYAVGCYFVPLANVFQPFRATDEIWRGARLGSAQSRNRSWPVVFWWFSFLSGALVLRNNPHANDTLESLKVQSQTKAIAHLLLVTSAAMAIWIVRGTTARLNR